MCSCEILSEFCELYQTLIRDYHGQEQIPEIVSTAKIQLVPTLIYPTPIAERTSTDELKKDPGIPRLPQLKVRIAEKRKSSSPAIPQPDDPDAYMAAEPTLSSLAALASETQEAVDQDTASYAGSSQKTKEQIRRHYVRVLHKVIDESDIVILVLDARDPEGCRSRLVEEEVRRRESEGKKLVFVLNKIGMNVGFIWFLHSSSSCAVDEDLVSKENAQQWLRYLRHSTPTLPFRSASSNQRSHLSSTTAPGLMRLLKAFKPSSQSITVGVVGFPNVGKSSLINSLKRSKACAVAAQPGHTKDLQSVQLERGIKIVDSPGVVFDEDESGDSSQKGSILLRNVVKVEDIEDPIAVVEEILARTEHETLRKLYNLLQFSSTLEFLTMLALNSGRLLKGGTPDLLSAARHVLMDWNHQKIPYFSVPPTIHPSSMPSATTGAETVGQSQILDSFSKPFELAGLFCTADAGAFNENAPMQEEVAMDDSEVNNDIAARESGMIVDDGMTASALSIPSSRKRIRSPSLVTQAGVTDSSVQLRIPKRFRRAKDLSAYEEAAVRSQSRAMNRRSLKQDRKRARRAANKLTKGESRMEVDGLQETFIADVRE
ncbi:P-loop containing nucleoside triphosphate hydrolase protein [Suillus plorans]|uniref:P-loop containing nucleoside triphosphate hydrolase protein n=1 Tax=Suillus plorans TaxID=116603 RepID=A0A9P7DGP9_9AGAM|nr:P-loop containing nucleoside triphosphate hydrolase protein [Suillus plorans]KAG1792755.1 P-loop containing nucleoside triphosphate hydrolase protein [Suillus plorans]